MSHSSLREITLSPALGLPKVDSEVFHTEAGTPYLRRPGVAMIARSQTDISGLSSFLHGFGPELNFGQYLDDPSPLDDATQLAKAAGQACYAAFGEGVRSMNADADRYITGIKEQGHGSVLEHPSFSLLLFGISRSNTHELVRHRAGMAYSQLSQRYVNDRVLRFVERPEFASDEQLHAMFVEDIDRAASRYAQVGARLAEVNGDNPAFIAMAPRDRRKYVNQAARDRLPNETETFLVMSGNARSWRHFVEMRASQHAETAIRALAVEVFRCLLEVAPVLFNDHELSVLPDGTLAVIGGFNKV